LKNPPATEKRAVICPELGLKGTSKPIHSVVDHLRPWVSQQAAPLPPADVATRERDVAALRTMLGDDAFMAHWAAGQALPLERAIAEALEQDAQIRPGGC
jgi:hypothetical protein